MAITRLCDIIIKIQKKYKELSEGGKPWKALSMVIVFSYGHEFVEDME